MYTYNNKINVINAKSFFKRVLKFFFGKKYYNKIIAKKVRLYLWFFFIKSLLALKNNKFYIYNLEGWHIGDIYQDRKKKYSELFQKDFKSNIIDLDLHSSKMISFFIFFLKLKKFKFNKFLDIKKNRLSNKKVDFVNYFKTSMWDISLRDKFLINSNHLPYEINEYENNFKNFKKKKINKNLIRQFINLLKLDSLDGFIITQECYEDWAITLLAIKYNFDILLFESRLGFLKYKSVRNEDIHEKNSKLLFNMAKEINKSEYEESEEILKKRILGNYESQSMFYMTNILEKNEYVVKEKRENPIFLFLHAFVDGPNIKSINQNSSSFIDYYHFSLWVIDFCIENNYPLYIKPHPNRSDYKSEIYFLDSFKNALEIKKKTNKKFYYEFINEQFSSNEITKFKNPIAFTGRGSIIIEMAFLGIPCFTFFKNDYLKFSFSNYIKNLSNLQKLIKLNFDNFEKDKIKDDAIKVEAILNKIEKNRIFEFRTISQLIKRYNKPEDSIKKTINVL